MQTAPRKVINGWAMYDWANSVYNLVITSTIFPAYFEAITGDGNDATAPDRVYFLGRYFVNTALYNYALAFAMLIVAIISPLLSSIADYRGNKKSFLRFFLTMGSISCATMYFFRDTVSLGIGIAAMIVACVGFWASLVYYNSYLPEIAAPEDRDKVSARGYTYGYIGSVILQLICFALLLQHDSLGITEGLASRYSFLMVGIWWFAFGQFALSRLPRSVPAGSGDLKHQLISKGYRELSKVWNQLKQLPVLKRYLFAFFFYNMGVQTVMLAATLYGKSELQIKTTDLMPAILIIQLIAIPGAFTISWLSKKIGNMYALMCCVLVWISICIIGYQLPVGGVYPFWSLAVLVGFVMGGIQSLSRSTYSKLMPVTKDTASFFSFYDVTEKVSIVIGMFSFGFINELTGSQRSSVLALMAYFLIGMGLLFYTKKAEKN